MTGDNSTDANHDATESEGRDYLTTEAEAQAVGFCGATNRNGEPCRLPAGWGTPGSGGERCKFHGGASTGPEDTSHLEGNDYAEGNPGGSPPELNANAAIHGGFSNWRKAYERFDEETRAYVERHMDGYREVAAEQRPDLPRDRREELLRELATRHVLEWSAIVDAWFDPDGSDETRGLVVEREIEAGGETYTVEQLNPAVRAEASHSRRQREIQEKLRLLPGYQRDDEEGETA